MMFTRLPCVVRFGRKQCLELCITSEADVNHASESDGLTAFHLAAVAGHVEIVKLLLERGADAAAKTHAGYTGAELVEAKQEQERRKRETVLQTLQADKQPKPMDTQTDLTLLSGGAEERLI